MTPQTGLNGYWLKLLRVDLTRGKVSSEQLDTETMRQYIGGIGLATKLIYDEVSGGADALGPENKVVFSVGPLQGIELSGLARWTVAAKSPLTGIWGESNAGGYWGYEFKKTGHDALIVEGKSAQPVFLSIRNEKVTLEDASGLHAMDTYETERSIKRKLNDSNARVACIGPAGESLARIACIVSDMGNGVAGRCGLGAVLGSKNLKAIAVRGKRIVNAVKPDRMKDLSKKITSRICQNATPKGLREHGQAFYMVGCEELGLTPKKNWTKGSWADGAERIGAPVYTRILSAKPLACFACALADHRRIRVASPSKYALEGVGPQYETLAMLGSNLLIDDVKAIAKMNEKCNRLGIDTISTGNLVGFVIECHERRLLRYHADDPSLTWGNVDSVMRILGEIPQRKGIGGIICDGITCAVDRIGSGARDLAVHVKGLDMAGHDPRAAFSMAVSAATSNRGGCHLHGFSEVAEIREKALPEAGISELYDRFSPRRKGYIAAKFQDFVAFLNSVIYCYNMVDVPTTLTEIVEFFSAVTGWEITPDEALKCGERIHNLQRMFNIRCGINAKDDVLPQRLLTPLANGGAAGQVPPMKEMLDEYYSVRGWDEAGIPSRTKLEELGLRFALQDM